MENKANKLIYGSYCRKSSESEDRQVLSLASQADKIKEIAKSLDVKIDNTHSFSESKSAKVSGTRSEFIKMLGAIEKGEINVIISWHADRLSRNAMDSALLIDLMDRCKLIEIVTPGQTFRNTPIDKFMFMLSCSQAKMENDKKGIDVKRGLDKKASLGNFPGHAPLGYMNDPYAQKGEKIITTDPERYDLVSKAWKLALTGTYSVLEIRKIATEEWGLRNKHGKKIGRNAFYSIFTNPFYCATFEYPRRSGQWFDGNHQAMITKEEYDQVQVFLGKKSRPRPKSHIFEFTGMIHCGECGGVITAEQKTKRQKNGNIHSYIYYHCTKRQFPNCTQGCLEVIELKKQVINEIESIEIPPEFHSYAMKWFRAENEKEAKEQKTILDAQQKAYSTIVARLSNLIDMRASGEITPEDFAIKQEKYLAEKNNFKTILDKTDGRVDQWNRSSDEMLTFIEQAKDKFTNGTLKKKREILSTLGSNLLLKDKILSIDIENCLFPMKKVSQEVSAIKERLEPLNTVEKQGHFERLCSESPIVLRTVDAFRTANWTKIKSELQFSGILNIFPTLALQN